jgi:hypothetical protein
MISELIYNFLKTIFPQYTDDTDLPKTDFETTLPKTDFETDESITNFETDLHTIYLTKTHVSKTDFKTNVKLRNEIKKIIKKIYDQYITVDYVKEKVIDTIIQSSYNLYCFYFFDQIIENTNIIAGSIKNIFDSKILKLCNINYNNLYDIALDNHAMCFYNFKYNNRNYLIFSNSGKGIDYCQSNDHNFINNKLYYYRDDFNLNVFLNFIIKLSNKIWEITILQGFYRKKELLSIFKDIRYIENYSEQDFIKDIQNLVTVYSNQRIDFLYIILDYYSRKNIEKIYPCNFQHVIDGESIEYTNYVINLNNNYMNDLNEFFTNYTKPIEYITTTECSENFKKFISYINDLNLAINNINLPSFHYNAPNKTIHVDSLGLVYSYQQYSGSCVFYSVFNILIIMLFLNNFKDNNQNNVIISLLTINYIFLLLLCVSYDKKFYLEPHIRGAEPYNTNQIHFINNIYENLDFIYEIYNFYPSNNTLFNIDLPIDYYYNISINKNIDKVEYNLIIHDNIDYKKIQELSKKIYMIIHDIRNQVIKVINSSIKQTVYNFFDNLYHYYNTLGKIDEEIIDYCNGYKDIYVIYLCWLIKIYNEKGFIFVNSNSEIREKKYFLYNSPVIFNILVPVSFNKRRLFLDQNINEKDLEQIGVIDKFKIIKEYYSNPLSYNHILLYFNYDELSSFSNIYLDEYQIFHSNTNIFINKKYEFIKKYLNLGYFENLKYLNLIHFKKYTKQIDNNNFILNNNKQINYEIDTYYLSELEQYIYYYNVYQYSNTTYQSLNQPSLVILKKKLIELTIHIIKKKNLTESMIMLYIFVLSDFQILYYNTLNQFYYFNYVHLLNKNTTFITYYIVNIIHKIKEVLFKNTNNYIDDIKKIFNILPINYIIINEKLEKNKFVLIENSQEKTLFIKNNVIYELLYSSSIYSFIYTSIDEINYKPNNNYGLVSSLNRFGINLLDNHLILIPTNKINGKKEYNLIIKNDVPMYIFIKDHDTYMEINFKEFADLTVDYDNCYIYKNNKQHKLILNADFKSVPFLKLLPPITPFLLYKTDNQYNIDIILSKNFISKFSLFASKFTINDNIDNNTIDNPLNYEYIYLTFVVADSLFMPINNKFINDYNKLLNYYGIPLDNSVFSLKFDNEYIKNKFKYIEDISFEKNIIIIKNFFIQLSRNISIDVDLDEELLQIFNKNNLICKTDFEKILKQNRLCTYFAINNHCLIQKEKLISYLNIYVNQLLNRIYNKLKITREIIKENMNEILKIRICNYVITILSSINEDTKCWDIQQKFTYFDNILFLLNNLKKKNFFYMFEIIYVLSNSFIFNEEQFNKYRDILDNLIKDNHKLNLNHFLMGKGKSSFLTPILSMAILILKKKYVSIITAEHLINDMKEYTSFYEYILSDTIQIETPTEAKKNFLMITSNLQDDSEIKNQQTKKDLLEIIQIIKDTQPFKIKIKISGKINYGWKLDKSNFYYGLHYTFDNYNLYDTIYYVKKNDFITWVKLDEIIELNNDIKKKTYKIINKKDFLINTINIIDEFDLHYNYISSMFNIVSGNNIINSYLFKYICLYLYHNNEYIFEKEIKKEILFISDVFPTDHTTKLKELYIESNYDEKLKIQILKIEEESNEIKIKKKNLHELINTTCQQLKIKKYNLDYGFDNVLNKANNLCIPYIRKSTPMTGSKFSDLLLTIIFTIDFYKTNNYKLRPKDFEFLDNYPFLYWKIFNIPFENKENIKEIIDKDRLIVMLIDYLYYTNGNDELKYSVEQYNCSFQDIIYNKYNQLQVGYTGTAFIRLRNNDYYKYPDDHSAFQNIILDNDLYMELYLALSCYGKKKEFPYKKILEKVIKTEFNIKRSSGHIENNWRISDSYNYDSEMVDCENDDFTKTIHIDEIIKYNPNIFSISCGNSNDEIIRIIKEYQPFKIKLRSGKINHGWVISNTPYIDDNNIKCKKKKEKQIVNINQIIEINSNIKNKLYEIIHNREKNDFSCNHPYDIEDSEDSSVKLIDSQYAENIIGYIFEKDHTIDRGIVDICGIFSDITNINISKIILTHKQDSTVVYFDENHNAYEIINGSKPPSIYNNKPTNSHFYYYDQTHCVGKDLKTPQVGHVSIILDNKTRLTEFLQGIFRFRNLNKGTYLSFYMCKFETERLTIQKISGKKIYKIIYDNEKNFQDGQEMGLNLQFFKTLVRYKNNDYKEIPFKPLFIENMDSSINYGKVYLDNLIHNLSEDDINRDLYNYFLDKDNIIQFKSIILNTNTIEVSNEVQNQKQIENQRQNIIDISRIKLIEDIKLEFLFIHYNCSICHNFIGSPLFNNEYFTIHHKNIYISNNLIIKNNYPYVDDLCFIVMNNLILIEKYSICQLYYYNKFPCYEFKTCKLLNIGITIKNNLEFDENINSQIFISLFGLYVEKIYNGNIEKIEYIRFCSNFNSVAFHFIYIYYLIYLSKDNFYIFDPILYEYKNPDDNIINSTIHECYTKYIHLKKHISGETFDSAIISKEDLPSYTYLINKPYTDNTENEQNMILTLQNKMKYDQHYNYQNYF